LRYYGIEMPPRSKLPDDVVADFVRSTGLEDRRGKLIATTFLVLGNTNLEEQDKKQLVMDVVDEQFDTLTDVSGRVIDEILS
jgi:hypothetical protein